MQNSVLVYTNYAAPYEGNFIAAQRALANELKKANIQTIFVLPEHGKRFLWPKELQKIGVVVYYLPDNISKAVCLMSYVIKKYYICFAHTHFLSRKQLFVLKVARTINLKKFPIIEHFHNHYVYNDNFLKQRIKQLIMREDILLACGSGVADSLKEANLKNEIDYIDNAIDFDRFDSLHNKTTHDINLLMFGADYKRKGVDIALKAVELLQRNYPNLKLNICLSINRDLVENSIRKIYGKIPEWVVLLPPTNNITQYYNFTDIFVSPSREEGLCYSLIEASYCDCIVVASRVSGQIELKIPDIVWCEPNNVESFRNALERVLCFTIDERIQLLRKLKQAAIENYTLYRWVNEILEFYRKKGFIK